MNPASAIQAYKKIVQESQTLIFERVRLYKQLRESEADKRKIILTTIYKGVLREQELIVHTLSVVKLSLKKEITETFGTNSTAQPLENCLALLIESKEPINRAYGKALYALEKELLSEDCSPDTVAQILKTLKLNLQDFEVEFESIRNQLTNKHYLEQTTVIIEKRASEIVSETINTSLLKKYGLAVKNNALVFGPGLLVAAIGAAIGAKVIGEDRGLLSMTALMWFSALVPGYGTTFAQMYIQNKDTKYINPITGLFDSQLYAKDIVDFVLTDYLSDPISYTPALGLTNAALMESDINPLARGLCSSIVAGIVWLLVATPLFPLTSKASRTVNGFFKSIFQLFTRTPNTSQPILPRQ